MTEDLVWIEQFQAQLVAKPNLSPAQIAADLDLLFTNPALMQLSFSALVKRLIESPVWQSFDYDNNPYKALCLQLSNEIEAYNLGLKAQPAYHSLSHFKDVCLSITLLIAQQIPQAIAAQPTDEVKQDSVLKIDSSNPWYLSAEEAWILLFAAIGHDFGHTGMMNAVPFEIEKKSIEQIHLWLRSQNLSSDFIDELMSKVETIILATDPRYLKSLFNIIQSTSPLPTKLNYLSMLMVEADLLASSLPTRGVLLTEALATEWQAHYPDKAQILKAPDGRLKFLQHIAFLGPHAQRLALNASRMELIEQLQKSKPISS
ncbi:hypothetical protein MCEZE4_00357 [Burkholderiaceae bacterium]|jgi:hypothetical protein